jgi:hypothetical protein
LGQPKNLTVGDANKKTRQGCRVEGERRKI